MNLSIIRDCLLVVLSIVIFAVIYLFLDYLKKSRVVHNSVSRLYTSTEKKYKTRLNNREKVQLEEGNTHDTSFLYKLDLLITRSQIQKYMHFLNPEIYLILNMILGIVIFLVVTQISGTWLLGLVVTCACIFAFYTTLYIMAGRNYERIDRQLSIILDLIDNHSGITDDFITIMGRVATGLEYPLNEYLTTFYKTVYRTGDVDKALNDLNKKIENEKLKSLFINLEICSKNHANYRSIIEDYREVIANYNDGKEQRKAITTNGRLETIMCLGMGVVVVQGSMSFMPNIKHLLMYTLIGNIILGYCIFVFFVILWVILSFDKKGGR